mmetsp:Transcript_11951/g.19533  ORF Transcript_11951/g.19533 Transcript_11951/m.19533 type:complete len:203 (+) Transcript_11951:791-1399(+)
MTTWSFLGLIWPRTCGIACACTKVGRSNPALLSALATAAETPPPDSNVAYLDSIFAGNKEDASGGGGSCATIPVRCEGSVRGNPKDGSEEEEEEEDLLSSQDPRPLPRPPPRPPPLTDAVAPSLSPAERKSRRDISEAASSLPLSLPLSPSLLLRTAVEVGGALPNGLSNTSFPSSRGEEEHNRRRPSSNNGPQRRWCWREA